MIKPRHIELQGTILDSLPNASFRVELINGHVIIAQIAGNIRRSYTRIITGDSVIVELTPYGLYRGIIMFRFR